jgi:hypothetical protein
MMMTNEELEEKHFLLIHEYQKNIIIFLEHREWLKPLLSTRKKGKRSKSIKV